jgi:hypothetical protein
MGGHFLTVFVLFLANFVGSSSSSQGGEESQKVVVPGAITVTNMEALFKVQQQQQHDKFVPFHIPALSLSFTLFLLWVSGYPFFPPYGAQRGNGEGLVLIPGSVVQVSSFPFYFY